MVAVFPISTYACQFQTCEDSLHHQRHSIHRLLYISKLEQKAIGGQAHHILDRSICSASGLLPS